MNGGAAGGIFATIVRPALLVSNPQCADIMTFASMECKFIHNATVGRSNGVKATAKLRLTTSRHTTRDSGDSFKRSGIIVVESNKSKIMSCNKLTNRASKKIGGLYNPHGLHKWRDGFRVKQGVVGNDHTGHSLTQGTEPFPDKEDAGS
jgi:hypothetical protein